MFTALLPQSFLPYREPEPPVLLVRSHLTFEQWLLKSMRNGVLTPTEKFTMIEKHSEFILQCWTDEILWEKWRKNVAKQSK